MKKSTQARANTILKKRSPQSQILSGNVRTLPDAKPDAPAAVPNSTENFRFCISDTGETAHVNVDLTFSRRDFEYLRAAHSEYNSILKNKVGLDQYVMLAIQRESNRELFPGHPLDRMEDAVNEAIGLLKLISLASINFCGADSKLSIGIQNLSEITGKRLEASFDSTHAYAFGKYAPATPTPATT
jgi:hypothetical protein